MEEWISILSCGSATQTGVDILSQINRLTAILESTPIPIFDIKDFDITGLGNIGTKWQGFALCNGQNGTNDLRSKFIVGYDSNDSDYDSIGNTGGEKTHTLTIQEMPSHNHSFVFPYSFPKFGGNDADITGGGGNLGIANTPEIETEAVGSGIPHENLPPYFVLAFAQKI